MESQFYLPLSHNITHYHVVNTNIKRLTTYLVGSYPYLPLSHNITHYHVVNTNIKRLTTYFGASQSYLSLSHNITHYHVVNTNIKRLATYLWNRIIAESRRTDTHIASSDVLPIIIGNHLKKRHNTKKRRHNTMSLHSFIYLSERPQGIVPTVKINSSRVPAVPP